MVINDRTLVAVQGYYALYDYNWLCDGNFHVVDTRDNSKVLSLIEITDEECGIYELSDNITGLRKEFICHSWKQYYAAFMEYKKLLRLHNLHGLAVIVDKYMREAGYFDYC